MCFVTKWPPSNLWEKSGNKCYRMERRGSAGTQFRKKLHSELRKRGRISSLPESMYHNDILLEGLRY